MVVGGGGGSVCRDRILTKQFHLSCIRLLAVEFNTATNWCLLHCVGEWSEEACDSAHPPQAERTGGTLSLTLSHQGWSVESNQPGSNMVAPFRAVPI